MKVESIETLACDAGWRNYHFVKVVTDTGIVGWSEFDEGFGAPGVGTVIERLATRVVGQPVHRSVRPRKLERGRHGPRRGAARVVGGEHHPASEGGQSPSAHLHRILSGKSITGGRSRTAVE